MTEPLGTPTHITLHWTAGGPAQTFPEYHWCVTGAGGVVQTLPIGEKGAHTWRRNSNNIGISMCCCPPGQPPTTVQIEHTAKLVAELCMRYGIPVQGSYEGPAYRREGADTPDDTLVQVGTQACPTVTDHAWYARQDGYYPERWDIGEYLVTILAKARWYHDALKAHTAAVEFTNHVA